MTTFATLVTQCRGLIGDTSATVFTDDQVKRWINEAIMDISNYFPIRAMETIDCTVADRKYDFSKPILAVLSVEFPAGEAPPEYLQRRPYTHPDFWNEDGYYDILLHTETEASNPSEIWISNSPTSATQDIVVDTLQMHSALSADADVCTVPLRHEHLLSLFVRWKAWQELATTEGMDPDPIKLLAATQEVNAYRAERAYRNALKELRIAESESVVTPPWRMDKWDRTY